MNISWYEKWHQDKKNYETLVKSHADGSKPNIIEYMVTSVAPFLDTFLEGLTGDPERITEEFALKLLREFVAVGREQNAYFKSRGELAPFYCHVVLEGLYKAICEYVEMRRKRNS